jgi:hypothetical protein
MVERAFIRGYKTGPNSRTRDGRKNVVLLFDAGIEVELRRTRAPSGRRAWLATGCRPLRRAVE